MLSEAFSPGSKKSARATPILRAAKINDGSYGQNKANPADDPRDGRAGWTPDDGQEGK